MALEQRAMLPLFVWNERLPDDDVARHPTLGFRRLIRRSTSRSHGICSQKASIHYLFRIRFYGLYKLLFFAHCVRSAVCLLLFEADHNVFPLENFDHPLLTLHIRLSIQVFLLTQSVVLRTYTYNNHTLVST